jgi:hypothetical protein
MERPHGPPWMIWICIGKTFFKLGEFMDWIQTLSIIATVIACAYYIHRDIINDMKAQTARTDKLYEMFCETVKELGDYKKELGDYRKEADQKLNDYRKESDQKFYDMLKATKNKE